MKNLKYFTLSECSKLEKFPEIQGHMDCLWELRLDKTAIKDLPSSIEHLEGLRFLSLGDCQKLKSVPSNIFSRMKNLDILDMRGTAIEQLPTSVRELSKLRGLYLCDFQRSSAKTPKLLMPFSLVRKRSFASTSLQLDLLLNLSTLTHLNLSNRNLSEESFPSDFGRLSSLWLLDLSKNNFASIPASFSQLMKLERLYLEHCTSLRMLTSLPSSITYVNAHGCKSLERCWIPPTVGSPYNRYFIFSECRKLLFMDQRNNMANISSQNHIQGNGVIILSGSEIPQWFSRRSEGEGSLSVSLLVDHLPSYNNVKGIVICAALEVHGVSHIGFDLEINGYFMTGLSRNYSIGEDPVSDLVILMNTTEYDDESSKDYQPIQNLMNKASKVSLGSCIEASIIFNYVPFSPSIRSTMKVKELGIHLVMEEQT